MKSLREAKSYADLPDPVKNRLTEQQIEEVWRRAQSLVESESNLSWGDAITMSFGGTLSSPRLTIREAHMDALREMGLWADIKDPAIRNSESQAEETRESLQDELSEGRPEVTVGDIDTEPVREAVENAVPGTGNDADSVTPTSSSGGPGGVGAVVAVVLALLAGAAALLGGED